MEHLENHPYALLDANDKVINVVVFDNHDADLIEAVRIHYEAVSAISCCEYGPAYIDGDFYKGKFYEKQPDSTFIRDEEKGLWVDPNVII